MARIRYLTFDCYGTLVDWRKGIETELRRALGDLDVGGQELLNAYVAEEAKREQGYKKYREVLAATIVSMSETLGVEVGKDAAAGFAESVPRWPAFPDSVRFLQEMGSRGYKRYILSNVDTDLLERTIKNNRLEVDGFVTAEEVRSYKPDPRHWRKFIDETGARESEILHVAQSVYHDIIPAGKLRIATAWINRYNEKMPEVTSPSYISMNLNGLGRALS